MSYSRIVLAVVTGVLITGCATSPGDDLSPFGTSVRHAMESQTYRPGDETPPLSGDKAARTLELYRGKAAQPMLDGMAVGTE